MTWHGCAPADPPDAIMLREPCMPMAPRVPPSVAYPVDSGSSIYRGYAGFDDLISSDALCGRRAVLARSGGRLAAARRTPERFSTLARIVSFDDIPIARRLVMCGEPKQGFK